VVLGLATLLAILIVALLARRRARMAKPRNLRIDLTKKDEA
jgi:hypothetical protein